MQVAHVHAVELASAPEQARARAGLFCFVAALLNEAPDLGLVRRLRALDPKALGQSSEVGPSSPASQAIYDVVTFVESTRTQPDVAVQEALAVDWTRLFRGVTPGYGPTPPYEGLFSAEATGHLALMQAIQTLYIENGAALTGTVPNRPDYLGLELAFAGFLNEAAAAAWERGEAEAAVTLADRAQAFVAEHPARWASRFVQEALPKAQTGFYRGLLRLIQAMLAEATTPESTAS